jgi:glycosyltransferase involved in cell wall biosynthesis
MNEGRRQAPAVVFLYTELAAYVTRCFEALSEQGVEVHVVAFPVNPEAPFQFDFASSAVHYCSREEYDFQKMMELIEEVSPALVFCSGWLDKTYLRICQNVKGRIKTVLISDNALIPGFRPYLSVARARIRFRRLFNYAFVSGQPQVDYVRRMGFAREDIYTGFYTADLDRYIPLSKRNLDASKPFPKRLIYVGRYIHFKGLVELWEVVAAGINADWILECLGTGPLWEDRKIHSNIIHHGFVQPDEIDSFVERGGVFILPSHREPWGVVVHEFAAAGYPMILSDQVNARTAFLSEGKNGFVFKAGRKTELRTAIQRITELSDSDLRRMAGESVNLAKRISIANWLTQVFELIKRSQ